MSKVPEEVPTCEKHGKKMAPVVKMRTPSESELDGPAVEAMDSLYEPTGEFSCRYCWREEKTLARGVYVDFSGMTLREYLAATEGELSETS